MWQKIAVIAATLALAAPGFADFTKGERASMPGSDLIKLVQAKAKTFTCD